MASHWGNSWGTNWAHSWDVSVVPPVPPAPSSDTPQGGTGGGGRGGAKWERASSSDGAKPGQLSVKEQNLKEARELEAIEREIARQEEITANKPTESELNTVKGLVAEAKAESEKVTAMAAAFEAAEQAQSELLAREVVAREELEQALLDEEEEDILILLATIH